MNPWAEPLKGILSEHSEQALMSRCVLKILYWDNYKSVRILLRSLFVFIRCKVSSLISHVARITPSSTYTFHSTKIQKSTRHNL